jgi:hypothetical protein
VLTTSERSASIAWEAAFERGEAGWTVEGPRVVVKARARRIEIR